MMFFLVHNIFDYVRNLIFRIGKSTIPFLPCKGYGTPILRFNPLAAFCFYILYKGRNRLMRPHTNKNVNMTGHAIYLKHLVLVFLEYTSHIPMQIFFPFFANQRLPVFYGKNKLNMKLRISIRHTEIFGWKIRKIFVEPKFNQENRAQTYQSHNSQIVPMERKSPVNLFLPTKCSYGT